MSAPAMAGLSTEQAPPLAIPMAFFASAPLSLCAAGALLVWYRADALVTPYATGTIALAHLGTLGVLTMVMCGALYQMIPVLTGGPVPAIRLAHVVHAGMLASIVAFVLGLALPMPRLVFVAISLLGPALMLFVVPVGRALARHASKTATTRGMQLALGSLVLLALLGLWMAHGHYGGGRFPGPRPIWMQVHLGVALLGWVGALITSVSWQVIPMFFLADAPGPRVRWGMLSAIALGVLAPIVLLGAQTLGTIALDPDALRLAAAIAASPAALAVWVVHPALTLASLRARRRKRPDVSLRFWLVGLALGPLTFVLAIVALATEDPRGSLLFGWVAILGWAGLVVHGMLVRIVPFLVWFHRFSRLIGTVETPTVRQILPDGAMRAGLVLHGLALVAGALAIVSEDDRIALATGLALVLLGVALGRSLLVAIAAPRNAR